MEDHPFDRSPRELYEPVDYIMQLGGKRLRPLLLLMSYQLFRDDVTKALPAAMAMEVFHNFTLVHDDIMDEAPLRRGKPTVHIQYDRNRGILAGDVMLIQAFRFLLDAAAAHQIRSVTETFCEVAIGVCEGQQLDMNFETRDEVTLPEYLRMIELKTAILLGGAMKIGALLADAAASDAQHLFAYGNLIGVAFQIQDDLLDAYGDPDKFGKKTGGDILRNKKTYLLLKAFELADAATKIQLNDWLTSTDETAKVAGVLDIYDRLQVRKKAQTEKNRMLLEADQHLDAIACPPENKAALRAMASSLIDREH